MCIAWIHENEHTIPTVQQMKVNTSNIRLCFFFSIDESVWVCVSFFAYSNVVAIFIGLLVRHFNFYLLQITIIQEYLLWIVPMLNFDFFFILCNVHFMSNKRVSECRVLLAKRVYSSNMCMRSWRWQQQQRQQRQQKQPQQERKFLNGVTRTTVIWFIFYASRTNGDVHVHVNLFIKISGYIGHIAHVFTV